MSASFSVSDDYVYPNGLATFWRLEENKVFEVALAKHYLDADRYDRIAAYLPNKTATDVQRRFRELEDDLQRIEEDASEGVSPPSAPPQQPQGSDEPACAPPSKKPKADVPANGDRRKGVPWTEEEHRLFLMGLAKFGKGDWRSIARNFVVSRTPTQVASHAQKYFIRLNSMNKKDKRRASIHDITNPHAPAPGCSQPPPVTGQLPGGVSAPVSSATGSGSSTVSSSAPAASPPPMAPASPPTLIPSAASTGPQAAAVSLLPTAAAAAAAAAATSMFTQLLGMHAQATAGAAAAAVPPPPAAMIQQPYMVHC